MRAAKLPSDKCDFRHDFFEERAGGDVLKYTISGARRARRAVKSFENSNLGF